MQSQKFSAAKIWAVVMAGVVTSALSFGSAARADQAEEAAFYKGKNVRLIVGYGPGGGYDVYARMIASDIGKHLGANVIVENQPGAGGITALNNLTTLPPDGLAMMIVNGTGAALAQLVGQTGVRYDLGTLEHLGTVSASPWVWLVRNDSAYKTPDAAIAANKDIMWGGSGPMDGLSDGAAFTCEALKMKCRVVMGYGGSNEVALALTKGEMDAMYVSDTSANNYVKGSQIMPVAVIGRKKSRFFPDVKTIFDLTKMDKDNEWLIDFRANLEALGRILVTTPKVPAARLQFMRQAVMQTLTDPALVAEGEKSQRYLEFEDAMVTEKRAKSIVTDITPAQKKRVVDILAIK
jgi:tripartite-type tricarboxylate transporter receptor subunit TctC